MRSRLSAEAATAHGPTSPFNPVVTAAEITGKLGTIVPLQIAPDEAGVVTVSCLQGGETWNIIPDTCTVIGGIRYFSVENFEKIVSRIRIITDSLCAANDCKAEYITMPKLMYPVINDPAISKLRRLPWKSAAGRRGGEPAWMASESFGAYQNVVPGVFAFVGFKMRSWAAVRRTTMSNLTLTKRRFPSALPRRCSLSATFWHSRLWAKKKHTNSDLAQSQGCFNGKEQEKNRCIRQNPGHIPSKFIKISSFCPALKNALEKCASCVL